MSIEPVPLANSNDIDQPTDQTTCANCGASIDRNQWHPVRATTADDDFRIHAFCSERCREAWSDPDD